MSDDSQHSAPDLGMGRPHPARIYDYLLGGKDNFPPDRAAAEQGLAAAPDVRDIALANRRFLVRVVRHLAGLGCASSSTSGPGSRPVPTCTRSRGGLPGRLRGHRSGGRQSRQGAAGQARGRAHARGDLREPEAVLAEAGELLDLGEPVALLVVSVTHNVTDAEDPAGILARYMKALAPGSYLAVSQMASDVSPERSAALADVAARQRTTLLPRTHAEVLSQFGGLELLEPGLVQVPLWHPDEQEKGVDLSRVWTYGGVALKA
nr:SAM-dependent methyltransferase [Planobispora longispora]